MCRLLLVLLLIITLWANASEVVKQGTDTKSAFITQETKRPWTENDRVCIFRGQVNIVCGTVTKLTSNYAKVEFPEPKQVEKGDEALLLIPPDRVPASTPEVGSLQTEARNVTYAILGGINMTLDRIFPKIEFQGMLTTKVSLGIQPAFTRSVTFAGTNSLTSYGVMFTANYYSSSQYRGLWLQWGTGIYFVSEDSTGAQQFGDVPVLSAIVGWREFWALNMTIGLGIGARYISFPQVANAELQFQKIQPTVVVDIGLPF